MSSYRLVTGLRSVEIRGETLRPSSALRATIVNIHEYDLVGALISAGHICLDATFVSVIAEVTNKKRRVSESMSS